MQLSGIGGGGEAPVVGVVNLGEIVDPDGILVVYATEAKLLREMIKSVAVVTDVGGAMSHAAIVCMSRNIPFVVGTKRATSELMQGDFVEVDPVAGTVTKL